MKAAPKSRFGTRGQPEESRNAILQAAVGEFAREGFSGARTDAIARDAGVNKALLYYYFKDKEALYAAVLDLVFGGLTVQVDAAFSQPLPPREKLLAYAQAHFDYVASHSLFPAIVQGEMLRARRGGRSQLDRIAKQYFRPLFLKIAEVIRSGQASGDFRDVDPQQFIPSMIAVIVFYFTNTPTMKLVAGVDPLSEKAIAERRAAVLDFISAALFREKASKGERP